MEESILNKSANAKFNVGDYVETTSLAKKNNLWFSNMPKYGRVIGFGRHRLLVRVLVNKRKNAGSYHMDFWRKLK